MIASSAQTTGSNSVLVLDIDQAKARAVLCDVVEGTARLVDVGEARSTAGAPTYDLETGLTNAIRKLEENTGRRVMDEQGLISPVRPDGDGVDSVFITGSPAPIVRVGMLAFARGGVEFGIRSAIRRTMSSLYDAGDYFDIANGLTPSALETWLRDARPTILILVARTSTPDDWRAALDVVASHASESGATQAVIVGNDQQQQVAAEVLDELLDLSGIDPESYEPHEIASALETELRDQYASVLQQIDSLRKYPNATFVDRIQSIENVTAFLHRRMGRNLAVVLNNDGTLLELAAEHSGVSVFRGDLDSGRNARALLQHPAQNVIRWLPFQLTEDEVRHWLLNRTLRPHAQLLDDNDRALAAAVDREVIRTVVYEASVDPEPDIELILIGREFTDAAGPAAILVALDALAPLPAEGVVMVSLDRDGVAASFGAIAATEPDYAQEVIENDFLSPVASCVMLKGNAFPGENAAQVQIVTDQGEHHELELKSGEVRRFPLEEGRTASVVISPAETFSVGRYAAGEIVRMEDDRVVHGGELGIIFDSRGRQATPDYDAESRQSLIKGWTAALENDRT